jgi:hypothetical protein
VEGIAASAIQLPSAQQNPFARVKYFMAETYYDCLH